MIKHTKSCKFVRKNRLALVYKTNILIMTPRNMKSLYFDESLPRHYGRDCVAARPNNTRTFPKTTAPKNGS